MVPIYIISSLIFGALVAVFIAIGLQITDGSRLKKFDQKAMNGKATATDQELAPSFFDRVIRPFLQFLSKVSRRVSPSGLNTKIKHNLIVAGNPRDLDVDKFLSIKALCSLSIMVILVFIGLIRFSFSARSFWASIVLVIVAFFLPDIWLHRKVVERQKAMRVALPDTLDLLTISVEAGLGFDSALTKVVGSTSGPLAEEFYRMLQEIQLGTSRNQAFRNLGERTGIPELDSFIIAMLQADIFGISIGKVLRIQAQEMRIKRRQKAEEIAMKSPVKIVFPLILCIFPALLVVVLGPAAISIYYMLTGL